MAKNFASTTGSLLNRDFSKLVRTAIDSINASKFINKAVKIEKTPSASYLSISNDFLFDREKQCTVKTDTSNTSYNKFKLNKNVYIAAFGKAALGIMEIF